MQMLALWLVLSLPCAWPGDLDPDGVRGLLAQGGPGLEAGLVEHEWALYSFFFPVLPGQGYPGRFLASGEVDLPNLGVIGGGRWRMAGPRAFEILTEGGEVAYAFRYEGCWNALVAHMPLPSTELGRYRGEEGESEIPAVETVPLVLRLADQPPFLDRCTGPRSAWDSPFCCQPFLGSAGP